MSCDIDGKLTIRKKLGSGGMGDVYLAHDPGLGRKVALKVLAPEFAQDDEGRNRFFQEARAVSSLNHPNILTVYEIGECDGNWFIATEYIEGKTLRELVSSSPLSLRYIVQIIDQIGQALGVAHDNGVIHRDIKPENVMVRNDGLVKVLDFGVAKLTESRNDAPDREASTRLRIQTAVGLILGTLPYMSPEQTRGIEVDARTDIWSLGVCFYEMVTGRQPFDGNTTSDIIAAILKSDTEPIENIVGNAPAGIKRIIFKALSKDLEDRYQTMNELLTDLRAFGDAHDLDNDGKRTYLTRDKLASVTTGDAPTRILDISRPTEAIGPVLQTNRGLLVYLGAGLMAVSLIVASVSISWNFYKARSKNVAVAVMPFVNIGNDPELEYLSDGITDSLISFVSRLPNLTVKARSSVFRYKNKETVPQVLGQELSVQSILTGRLIVRGDSFVLNVELVEAATGNLIWAETYSRRMTDLLQIETDLFADVAKTLRENGSASPDSGIRRRGGDDTEAYHLYLKGRYYLNTRKTENFQKAVIHFQQAIERSPDYALAYAGLSDTYAEMNYWSIGTAKDTMPKARAAARTAIEFDESLSEGHSSLALIAEDYDWDFVTAEREYRRSIVLNPNNAVAFDRFGSFLCEQKRFSEGHQHIEKANILDPLSLSVDMSKGACFYQERRYQEAIDEMQAILQNAPDYFPAYSLLGAIYFRQEKYELAANAWLKNSPLENYSLQQVEEWRQAFRTGGIKAFLETDISFRKDEFRKGRDQSLFIAMQYANSGDKEQALEWLERAVEERHSWLGEIFVEPTWDALRADMRFQHLMARIGFR